MAKGHTSLSLQAEGLKPQKRGSNQERRAATRAKVLDAAIMCLYEVGYSATTTTLVAAKAGVSRGALLHQFPTKSDLMVAVTEHVVSIHNKARRETLASIPEGLERFLALTQTVWKTSGTPRQVTFLEIAMGARSDPELAARLPEAALRINHEQRERVWRMAEHAGMKDRELVDVLFLLSVATMRGLAIERMMTGNHALIDAAMKMMLTNRERTIREHLEQVRSDSKPAE